MRVLILSLALLILTIAGHGRPAGAADDPPVDPPADPAATASDPADGEDPADGTAEAEEDPPAAEETTAPEDTAADPPPPLPEGVRRQRPRTAEQEREYKQRKTREDMFLNAPVPEEDADPSDFYNPAHWLDQAVRTSLARYIVQDARGSVLGSLTCDVSRETDPLHGESIRLRQRRDFAPACQLDLWLDAASLKPRFKESRTQLDQPPVDPPVDGAADPGVIELYQDSQLLRVDYLFDRATVSHQAGGISVRRTMRQLPFSYDIDELPLLMRQLDFLEPDWPFEAAVCDPQRQQNLPLAIAQPLKVENLLSAEPQTYRCYELAVSLGDQRWTYWVERLAPHRLVKYTDGELTYTLIEYLERE